MKQTEANYTKAGPTLLSQQSGDPDMKSSVTAKPDWDLLRSHLETNLVSLRTWRQSWWTQNWSDLAEFILPRRSIWLTQSAGGLPTPNNMTRGRPINNSIVDPTGTFAARVCAGGMMSGLASPSRPWFKVAPSVGIKDLDTAARQWLDDTESVIYSVLAASNFYNSFAQECEDLVVFGTAPVIIYEDQQDVIRCYNPAIGEYYLSSGSTMRVDGVYRQFVMSIQQIVDFFGIQNVTEEIKSLWAQKGSSLQVERIIAHSIEPNFGIGKTEAGKVKGNFTWREVYWVYGSANEKPLSIRGFVDRPFTCARWSTQSNDAYGRSPGMDVLPDVIQLQVETRRKAEAIEKMVRPPLVADMQLKNQPSSILPGHVTYVQGLGPGTGMRPIYEVNPDINAMMQDLSAIQQRIKTGFFNDIFAGISQLEGDRRSAAEIQARTNEAMAQVGPVVEGIMSESLKPKLTRIFGILQRRGLIKPPPKSLHNMPLDIQFTSTLAVAQKASATGGMERLIGLVGNIVGVYPEAKDNVDIDAFVRKFSDLLGNPQTILVGPDTMNQGRQAAAKKQAAAQQMQALQHGAQTAQIASKAAQNLAATDVGGGQTAISQLLGTGGGGV